MIGSLVSIAIVIFLILLIVNNESRKKICEKIKIKEIYINILFVIISLIICVLLVRKGIDAAEVLRMEKEIDADLKYIAEQQKIQNEKYNELITIDYEKQNYNKPYIPKGFEHIEGEWNTGYVIEDNNGNQYVWVPCTNKEIEGVTKLERRNFVNIAYMSKDLCYDSDCYEFIKSALANGGYYISRFEIGQENKNIPVSKVKTQIWTNITKDEAIKVISKIDEQYKDVTVKLMNSYSYDTAFKWIINTNNEVTYEIIESDENGKRYTGQQRYNNIYDLFDTTYEFTTEIYNENSPICRGAAGIYNDIMSEENTYKLDNRTSSLWDKADNLGFRTILYR